MYRRAEVIPALFGRVGFREPTQAEYSGVLDSSNKESRSGRYFDGFHAMVTIPNIKEIVNNDVAISNAAFNTSLKELQEDCICSVLDGIFNKPEIIEQRLEFDRCDEQPAVIPNNGRFVGRQIKMARDPRKGVRINAITLFFDGAVTFSLYLFNSTKKAALKTVEVTTAANDQVVIRPADWQLNYMDATVKSGVFYIGYFQDDLGTVKAYDEQPVLWNAGLCYGSQAMEADRVPGQPDFTRYNPTLSSRTYGLNIEYSTVKDYTEIILQNPQAFDKAIGLQMAAKVVEKVIHSTRSNYMQRLGEQGAARLYNDLNLQMATDEMPYSTGLKNQLERELKRLHNNFFPGQKAVSNSIPDYQCYSPKYRR